MENYENNNPENGEEIKSFADAAQQNEQPAVEPVPPVFAERETVETPLIQIDAQPDAEPHSAPSEPADSDAAQAEPSEEPEIIFYSENGETPLSEPEITFGQDTREELPPRPADMQNIKKFEYTPIAGDEKKYSNKGLKLFCLILAFIICMTAAGSVGYLFGRNSFSTTTYKQHSEIELAAKPDNGEEMTEGQVYQKVNESIVGIRVYNESGTCTDCSGVVYSDDGYIVSNDHIYSEVPNAKFKIYTYDGKEYDAIYIAGDQISDLTVLKVSGGDLKPAIFGDSDDVFCGEHVVAIGRPSSARSDSSITSGVVSLPKRRVKSSTSFSSSFIQTDSAINPGSSGGALVNMYGQVIGITSSKLAGVVYDSVCFAIPSRTVKRVCEDLIKEGKVVSRAKLGITYSEIDSVTAEVTDTEAVGLLISAVSSDSDLNGKVVEGDIITHVNNIKITADTVMLDIIENARPGDTITITVVSENGDVNDYKAVLVPNEGNSSYKTGIDIVSGGEENGNENGDVPDSSAFNFPFGD